MTAPHAQQIIDGYLARLEDETRDLPRAAQRDLVEAIKEHIDEARATLTDETDANLLNILDRLGDPTELAQEERDRLGISAPRPVKTGLLEIGAVVLLPFVWPVGVLLLWISGAWSWREKLLASILPPGGYWLILALGAGSVTGRACSGFTRYSNGHAVTTSTCGSSPGWESVALVAIFLLLLLLPILTSIGLAIRLRSRTRRSNTSFALQS